MGLAPTTRRRSARPATALRTSLHDIIDDNTKLSYDAVWTALKDTDQDPSNTSNVIELYTGRSIAKSNNGGGTGQWNREHVWAQSRGGFTTSAGPGTDLHHLRPEDVTRQLHPRQQGLRQRRLGRVGLHRLLHRRRLLRAARRGQGRRGADALLHGDPLRGRRRLRQPRDEHRPSAAPSSRIGDLETLLAWNAADPVDAFEMRRNDRIHAQWQGNRNPFIDHPEWAAAIWN